MPRRNFRLLIVAIVLGLACALRASRQGQLLVFAMNEIETRALETVEANQLFEGAMMGMTARLDSYSGYISPERREEFEEILDRQFGGIGVEIIVDPDTKQLTVGTPLFGSPAYQAGIRAGDKILKIGGQSTQGFSLEDASALLRGEPQTPVELTILHASDREPVDMTIVRDVIRVDTVLGDRRHADGSWDYFLEGRDRIGYLRIDSFAAETASEMRRAMDWLVEHKARGLILDVRNDPGGLLSAAIDICDMFVDEGVIVSTRGRDGTIKQAFLASRGDSYRGFPVAVLVNNLSASASEILAACLQDHKKAIVVGERTFGKGTVQELIALPGNQGTLKLTTASYWRPSNRNIHRTAAAKANDAWGVSPDPGYQVKLSDEQFAEVALARQRRDINNAQAMGGDPPGLPEAFDPQLKKAIDYIESAAQP